VPAEVHPSATVYPGTALGEFLATTDRFEDAGIDRKLLITVAPGGYLRCTRD